MAPTYHKRSFPYMKCLSRKRSKIKKIIKTINIWSVISTKCWFGTIANFKNYLSNHPKLETIHIWLYFAKLKQRCYFPFVCHFISFYAFIPKHCNAFSWELCSTEVAYAVCLKGEEGLSPKGILSFSTPLICSQFLHPGASWENTVNSINLWATWSVSWIMIQIKSLITKLPHYKQDTRQRDILVTMDLISCSTRRKRESRHISTPNK